MTATRSLLFAAALCALPLAASADPWQGLWAADPAWCKNAGKIGSVPEAPIRMTGKRIEGYENACPIKSVRRLGPKNAWHLVIECVGEGVRYDEHSVLMLDDDGQLWRWFGSGAPIAFSRCPG